MGRRSVVKARSAGRVRSSIALTTHGRKAFRGHVRALNAIIAQIADPESALADDALAALTAQTRGSGA